jgi:hypothetical protein
LNRREFFSAGAAGGVIVGGRGLLNAQIPATADRPPAAIDAAWLNLRVTDSAGRPLPCRLHLKLPDGSCFVPADAPDRRYTATAAPDLLLPSHFDPYLHLARGLGLQSAHLNHGVARLSVPSGRLRVYLARGHEFAPVMDELNVRPKEEVNKQYVLHRRINMPARGWFGGDMHTHFSRWKASDNHVWARLLNCGVRLACTGGSDFPFSAALLAPWYPNLGLDRTYAQVEGSFSYPAWLEAIRKGRTFATNGPLLFFTVDGQPPGSEIRAPASHSRMRLDARAVCNYGLDCLEIVCNGAVVKHVEGQGGQRRHSS